MELSHYEIKKILIFSQKKAFLIFPEMEPCNFRSKLEKIKKILPEKISYISVNRKHEKIPCNFAKESFFNILGNENPEKSPYISRGKTFLCFSK